MDKLGAFAGYIAAVRTGSLSGAARTRNLSQPAISQQIGALEELYGVRLLQRARSGVRMTPAGEVLYHHAEALLERLAALEAAVESESGQVAGRLVVTSNLGISRHVMSDVIVTLKRRHPGLEVELRADNKVLDLAGEGIDIALRSGGVGSGGGVARKIGEMDMVPVATSHYLDGAGRPHGPDDLARLDYVRFKSADAPNSLTLHRRGETVQAPIRVGFTAEHPDLIEKALHGALGYASMPRFLVSGDLAAGRLEPVLPGWTLPPTELFIVFSGRSRRSLRFTAFVGALLEQLAAIEGITLLASARKLLA